MDKLTEKWYRFYHQPNVPEFNLIFAPRALLPYALSQQVTINVPATFFSYRTTAFSAREFNLRRL
jgi:hypothetical protein